MSFLLVAPEPEPDAPPAQVNLPYWLLSWMFGWITSWRLKLEPRDSAS